MNNNYNSVKQRTETVTSALRDIAVLIGTPQEKPVSMTLENNHISIIPGLGMVNDATNLIERANDIQEGIFKIIALGQFKNGKSTILNAILGSKTLPARSVPCTAVISVLTYGDRKEVLVYETNKNKPRVLGWEEFTEEFRLTEQDIETIDKKKHLDRFQNIEYVQLECQHPFSANGIKLIDSPGLGEHISRTRVTTNFLKQAQAVIFVLNATKILSEDEKEFIETVFGQGRLNHVFFVINRINQIDEEERESVERWVLTSLKHHFLNDRGEFDADFYRRRVFFVNAKGALDGRTQKDNALLAASGVLNLEQELERFLTSDERVTAALEFTVQLLIHIITASRKQIQQRKLALAKPLAELEQNRQAAEEKLKGLERRKIEIERTLLLFSEMISRKTYASLASFVNSLPDTWQQDAERLINLDEASLVTLIKSIFSPADKEKLGQTINNEVEKYLRHKICEWAQQIPVILQADLQKMQLEIEAQISSFQLELDKIADIFTGTNVNQAMPQGNKVSSTIQAAISVLRLDPSGAVGAFANGGNWGNFFAQLLVDIFIINAAILAFGPAGWAVYLVAEGIHLWIMQKGFKEKLLKSIGKNLQENLPRKIAEQEQTIYQTMQQKFQPQIMKLTEGLQRQIDETRAEQDRIIKQKKNQSFSVEKETQRLNAIAQQLLHLFNQVSVAAGGRKFTPEELDRVLGSNNSWLSDRAA